MHPIVPPLIYLPVISFLLSVAVNAKDLGVPSVLGVFVLGVAFWSLTEYLLHRFVFHCGPTTSGAGGCTSSSTACTTTTRTTRCGS